MEIHAKTEAEKLFVFELASAMTDTGKIVSVDISDGAGKVSANVLFSNGESRRFTFEENTALHGFSAWARKAALGKALYNALLPKAERPLPYGTLTGVRPCKVPLYYMGSGKSEEEVLSVLCDEYFVFEEKARLLCRLAATERKLKIQNNEAMLYVSIPFCPTRCSYCSFISSAAPKRQELISPYLSALETEFGYLKKAVSGKNIKFRGVYIGGGTPGILSPEEIKRLITAIKNSFDISPATGFSFEAGRPDTVTKEKLAALKDMGVDRICINPQTISDKVLEAIGRKHSAEDFFRAMEIASEFDFGTVNCDLIAGLPSDTPEGFCESVKKVLSLSPQNITLHALCLKNAAALKDAVFSPELAKAVSDSHSYCIKNGFEPYYLYRQKNTAQNLENVGFSKPGHECIYNLAMMEDMCNVISAGAGASSKVVKEANGKKTVTRFYTYKYPFEYLKGLEKAKLNAEKISLLL